MRRQSVSEQACLRVLRAIAHERIESRFMSYRVVSQRAMYSTSYTRAVVTELIRRGWIDVSPGRKPHEKTIVLTEAGRGQLF